MSSDYTRAMRDEYGPDERELGIDELGMGVFCEHCGCFACGIDEREHPGGSYKIRKANPDPVLVSMLALTRNDLWTEYSAERTNAYMCDLELDTYAEYVGSAHAHMCRAYDSYEGGDILQAVVSVQDALTDMAMAGHYARMRKHTWGVDMMYNLWALMDRWDDIVNGD